jgi:3-deoxy-manno-octulosonate cytidylyltransferase (CMP-KDO synthetase)
VPFRLGSQRFPDKALVHYKGKPLLHIIITAPADDLNAARQQLNIESHPVELIESSLSCESATERAVEILPKVDANYLLTLPIDEPEITPGEIKRAISSASNLSEVDAITFYCDFYCAEDYVSPLSAKVVIDADGGLLFMSRAVVPVRKDGSVDPTMLKKNVGAFLFERGFLERLADMKDRRTTLDRFEGLEQLRWLELGFGVKVLKIDHIGFGIDIPDQLALLERRCAT